MSLTYTGILPFVAAANSEPCGRLKVPGAVCVRDAQRDRGQPTFPCVLTHQVFCGDPGPDVAPTPVEPIERFFLGDGATVLAKCDRDDTAGEHEASQIRIHGCVEHVTQALDVGVEQRRRITQPRPSVDDAVVHVIASVHRGTQGVVVEYVATVTLDVEVVDRDSGTGAAQQDSHSFTRSTSCLVTCGPRKPLAPSTSFIEPAINCDSTLPYLSHRSMRRSSVEAGPMPVCLDFSDTMPSRGGRARSRADA